MSREPRSTPTNALGIDAPSDGDGATVPSGSYAPSKVGRNVRTVPAAELSTELRYPGRERRAEAELARTALGRVRY
jgi:hypothetical protein